MTETRTYDFSFTGFSLRVNEMLKVALAVSRNEPLEMVDFGDGNRNTGQRRLVEIKKRLNCFNEDEFDLFLNGDLITQKQLAFLSVCKAHSFIREFSVEVLREKLLVFDYQLTEGDYITFIRRKAEIHPEMDDLTEITQSKIRQVCFKILEQAGIIDSIKNREIQPQILDDKLVRVLIQDDPNWLKVFFVSDTDILNIAS